MDKSVPQIGQIAKVLRGRDPGEYAVIIGIVDTRFVLLADGDKRKFDSPKKKNLNHLQIQNAISSEVESSIRETGRVTNAKLRFAIAHFVDRLRVEAQEKGE
ncbi:KOW domain-containing RNA-binding protein [Paenibacillus hexagrammi]|uniref:KOW domain-containing RNA-binding protein n=1 Tax=Paenibacillus hexagrammi TaxID=2908839 RepID=A0ABY3SKU7_9BACL|nr:KOW domain-containing RNA-binding protein [Paenibacillus sp. YPD9-1]UJF33706.1 KOW domain-containing RNA-binding protein [Paenibacillus sp. YPD9-1]